MAQKTIAFFPEAAYGPALNSVGIAQAVEARGHKAVFLSDPGFVDVYKGYGFEAHPVNLSEPMPPEQMAKFWEDFINGHIPNFRKSPYDQVDNYVKDCWTAIVDSAKWAEKDLPGVLAAHTPRKQGPQLASVKRAYGSMRIRPGLHRPDRVAVPRSISAAGASTTVWN